MHKVILHLGCVLAVAASQFAPLSAQANERSPITAISGCAGSHSDAAVVNAVPPDYPEIARQMGLTGTSLVQLDLTPSGTIANASILTSSGNSLLDRAALAAARASSFRSEVRDCTPVAGSYIFSVAFEQ
jgi:TonB family protein